MPRWEAKVSAVEMTDGLLPGADRDLVRPLQKRLQGMFQAIYLSTKVASLADRQDSIEVTFEGDVPEKVRRFSRAPLCVGRRPNICRPGAGEDRAFRSIPAGSFRSIASDARATPGFSPSATRPASRCWLTKPPTRARPPSK